MVDFTFTTAVDWGGGEKHMRYAPHPHCTLMMWFDPTRQGKRPVYMRHRGGGWTFNPNVYHHREPANQGIGVFTGSQLQDTLYDLGYIIMDVGYPVGHSAVIDAQPAYGLGGPYSYAMQARAVQWVRDNFDHPALGSLQFDVNRIVLDGNSAGGYNVMMSQWTPDGWGVGTTTPRHAHYQSPWVYHSSHRANVLINRGGPYNIRAIDWTAPGFTATAMAIFAPPGQYIGGLANKNGFDLVPVKYKLAASPQILLRLNKSEFQSTAVYANFGGPPSVKFDPTIHLPDSLWAGVDGVDDSVFGRPMEIDLDATNIVHRVRWGTAADNPRLPGLSGMDLAKDIASWLQRVLKL